MELAVLIRDLQRILDDADVSLDAGLEDTAREQLRAAKNLLDAEFLKD